MTLIQEKVTQAIDILKEKEIDLWITFVRETSGVRDPTMDFLFGLGDLTWPSALMLTRSGERIAIVGRYEAEGIERLGVYSKVIGYDAGISHVLVETIRQINPRQIAVNTSRNNVHADGLTHAMYEMLTSYLKGSPYAERLVSSEPVINALRGRKSPAEVERIRQAIATTAEIYSETFAFLRIGMTELEVADFVHGLVNQRGLGTAWEIVQCPMVNAGPESPVGHSGPTELTIQPGQLVHFDFGVRQDDYCSDIQRLAYVLRPGEMQAPPEVQHGFDVIRQAIEAARAALKPGLPGKQVDATARAVVTGAGFEEYKYATGHQLGRVAHDGGALLGPLWERYGESPDQLVESGNVFTIEPGLALPGYGYVGLEEDVLITENGAQYLGAPQTDLVLIQA